MADQQQDGQRAGTGGALRGATSSDGTWYWDGSAWRERAPELPSSPPLAAPPPQIEERTLAAPPLPSAVHGAGLAS
ncbi:MAG: hypothetical protein ACREQM_21310, partial [Candidatus Dormibacteraceae bacterium]